MADKINKVQINRVTRIGIDKWGKKVSETEHMFNIRCDDVEEAVRTYYDLVNKFYEKAPKKQ